MFQWLTGNAINFFESPHWSTQFIIIMIIASLILLFVNPLLLWLATKILKIKNNYKKSFITNLLFYAGIYAITVIVGLIINVGLTIENPQISKYVALALANFLFIFWLIKKRYKLDWKKGFLVWLMWTIFTTALGWITDLIYLFIGWLIIEYLALIFNILAK